MLEKPYKGEQVEAESASKYIDIETIIEKCNSLSSIGEGFERIGNKINTVGQNCGEDALSIDGETLENYIAERGKNVNTLSPNIREMTNNIINRAIKSYNDLQKKLNQEAYEKEKNMQ